MESGFTQGLGPGDDHATALRLRRLFMAVYSYLFVWAGTAAGVRLNLFAPDTPHLYLFGSILALNALFWVLIRSGYSTRWRDPALTLAQMVPGIILTTILIHYSRELQGALLTIYFMVMLFGIFALSRLQMILMSLVVLICYLGLVFYEWYLAPRELLSGATLGRFAILALGLLWFVYVGGHISNLRARVRRQRADLEELAIRDPLTRLYNRRYFDERLEEELARARRRQHHFFIGMVDLDHFKEINDTHGHGVGDEILRLFADCARNVLRESDLLARYGGEEFVVLFTQGHHADIQGVAERLRLAFAEHSPGTTPDGTPVTLSVGLSAGHPDDTVNTVIERADQALYRAKSAGRNRIMFHPEDVAEGRK
jgi:diguanylate cyclase (GGDEF)-like protein